MFPGTKVVAVDDDREELSRIVGTLRDLGIGCISYNYPNERPEQSNDSSVRVIFMDINLVGGNSPENDPQVFAAPISLIGRIISDTNGPYALITWSDTNLHESLVERIAQTPELANKQPFHTRCLPKGGFVGNPQGLATEVRSIFEGTPPFGALLDWERRVSKASNTVLLSVYQHSQRFAEGNSSEKMDLMLSHLAVASFGQTHADAHRFEAVSEALLPILGDALNSQFGDQESPSVWDAAVSRCADAGGIDEDTRALLNSAILLETRPGISALRRGAILPLPEAWLRERAFQYRFGETQIVFRRKILRHPDTADVRWVLVQVQAACDFNQPKPAPIPYFLGAIIAEDELQNPNRPPPSIYISPSFAPDGAILDARYRICIFHGNPHPLTARALAQYRLNAIGRLKDQLVEAVSHEHHKHASRPGILSF